ncbi:aldo/keto reductase [Isoptericola halotolerans]|uniref:Diketogulonate reductase-like aldo/keto reductase n=1 Tax=Isoptericola halotolerans TaxID=300560 RepID=A0ABX2A1C2_9MICO|nr:aldo/keto reductase [Isoptericola halotolerans]NOV95537.1 diketogulonate reductase-like aldo/keto reductase [Isoptericola halotolerans]
MSEYTSTRALTLPRIGFGTASLKGRHGAEVIENALRAGYRLIDSAFNYENEGTVGAAVRASGVPRDEVIVTSKLPGRHHTYDAAVTAIEESVYRTGLDHLDLYLIHWPNPAQRRYVEAWQALVEARERGLVRAIGVSNFLPEHIDRLLEETGVVPAVNQVELHPYFPQAEQRSYDAKRGIVTEAWSPIGRANEMLQDPVLARIADARGLSVPEVILAWHAHLDVVPLPKATAPERQRQNLAAIDLELTDDDVDAIAALARPDGRNNDQDPAVYEEF